MMAGCDVTFLVWRPHLKLTRTYPKNSHEGACADTVIEKQSQDAKANAHIIMNVKAEKIPGPGRALLTQ